MPNVPLVHPSVIQSRVSARTDARVSAHQGVMPTRGNSRNFAVPINGHSPVAWRASDIAPGQTHIASGLPNLH